MVDGKSRTLRSLRQRLGTEEQFSHRDLVCIFSDSKTIQELLTRIAGQEDSGWIISQVGIFAERIITWDQTHLGSSSQLCFELLHTHFHRQDRIEIS